MILFIGQVASSQRDREAFQEVDYRQMFGPGNARLRQVGRRGARRRSPAGIRRRAPSTSRCRGAPVRSCSSLPEDMLATPTAAAGARSRSSPRSPRRRPRRWRACASGSLRAERPFVIVGGSGWTADACEALERFAERWQLPVGCAFRFQDVFDNRHPNYAGDVGIGINPKLAARVRDADLIVAIGPRLGEMTTGGYELLVPPQAAPAAHPHPRRRRGARPRLCARPRDQRVDGVRGAGAGDARRRRRRSAGRAWTAAAHADYEANLVPTPVAPLDMAEVVRCIDRHVPRRHDLHQRRRQLRRLAEPLPSLRRHAPRRPHAISRRPRARWATACRPPSPRRCSSRIAPSSTSPATATS